MAAESEEDTQSMTLSEKDTDVSSSPVRMVFLPNSRQNQIIPPSIKLQIPEKERQGMNPNNMWQVYAFGGFLVLRWIWARWRERKNTGRAGGGPSSGEN